MDYAAWRCTYQDSEQAARAAYDQITEQQLRISRLETAVERGVRFIVLNHPGLCPGNENSDEDCEKYGNCKNHWREWLMGEGK